MKNEYVFRALILFTTSLLEPIKFAVVGWYKDEKGDIRKSSNDPARFNRRPF